ncbi:MAG: GNAT family N-acetyltransferase [Fimbriimonadaceae bacterium]|nr:GNAT family N-acetyltransferase [Fimbriimonadaceae bacterium]
MKPLPVTLKGQTAILAPLDLDHTDALFEIAQDEAIWRWMLVKQPETVGEMESIVRTALKAQAEGHQVPFVVQLRDTGKVVGATRYMSIRHAERGLEIGWTWYAKDHRRTALNTECKLMLLQHAFEELGAVRVELKTDERNQPSRTAILRIGAQFEGILRNYQTRHDGFVRNTAMFAITNQDWPSVKERLLGFLER